MHYRYKINKRIKLLILSVILSFGFANVNLAQTFSIRTDLERIENKKLSKRIIHHKRAYIFKDQAKSFKMLNPISLTFGGLLFLYQNSISQHFSADCLYKPSCSEFSKQCVHEFGLIKGGLLTFDRLNRCNRISAADIRPSEFDTRTHRCNDPISKY